MFGFNKVSLSPSLSLCPSVAPSLSSPSLPGFSLLLGLGGPPRLPSRAGGGAVTRRGGGRKGVSLTPRRPPAAPAFCAGGWVGWGRRPRKARPVPCGDAQSSPAPRSPALPCPALPCARGAPAAPHPCSSKDPAAGAQGPGAPGRPPEGRGAAGWGRGRRGRCRGRGPLHVALAGAMEVGAGQGAPGRGVQLGGGARTQGRA